MKLSEFKNSLKDAEAVNFRMEDGTYVPAHFHITEMGEVQKRFIDCGGTVRTESCVSLQLWNANDYEHRLTGGKLLKITAIAERELDIADLEMEVEYQNSTIGRYGLEFDGTDFLLTSKATACLAGDTCGAPAPKTKLSLAGLAEKRKSECMPNSGCC